MYIQSLDVHVLSTFQHHSDECAEEFIEKQEGQSGVKLTASQPYVICTRLVAAAWTRTLESVDMMKSFLARSYVWNGNSSACPRTLPGYKFDPISIDVLNNTIDLITTDEKKIDSDVQTAKELHPQHLNKQG